MSNSFTSSGRVTMVVTMLALGYAVAAPSRAAPPREARAEAALPNVDYRVLARPGVAAMDLQTGFGMWVEGRTIALSDVERYGLAHLLHDMGDDEGAREVLVGIQREEPDTLLGVRAKAALAGQLWGPGAGE